MFALKHVGEDGQEHDFHIDEVEPLGFVALRDCLRDGRRSHPTQMHGRLYRDGKPSGERLKLTCSIEFNERVPFYGLVPGGALPPMYLQGTTLVLDRNVVTSLKMADSPKRAEGAAECWLFSFLDSASNTVNPVLGAFEGKDNRTPTLEEFRIEVHDAAQAIQQRLPAVGLVSFSDDALRQQHSWRQSFDKRAKPEAHFLRTVAPFLSNTVATRQLEEVERKILGVANSCGLTRSCVVLAALARLYASPDGTDYGVAQKLLKLTHSYSEEAAYNALADLRQLELLAGSQGFSTPVALLTGDKALALFWCGLGVQSVQVGATRARFNLSPVAELFPRVPAERLAGL